MNSLATITFEWKIPEIGHECVKLFTSYSTNEKGTAHSLRNGMINRKLALTKQNNTVKPVWLSNVLVVWTTHIKHCFEIVTPIFVGGTVA